MYLKEKDALEKLNFLPCEDRTGWDARLLMLGYPHPWQSTAYGEYLRSQGSEPHYINIIYDGETIGHCLVTINPKNVARYLYGPIVTETCPLKYEVIVSALLQYLRHLGVFGVDFVTTQAMYTRDPYDMNHPLYSEIYEAPFVDLQSDFKEIYRSFHPSVRKNLKKCEKAGVDVLITSDTKALGPYLEMLTAHRARLGFPMPPFYPNYESKKFFTRPHTSIDVALASIDGKYLASLGFIVFGKVVIEVAVGQSDAYKEMKLPAHDSIKVRAIEYYGKKGIKYYDITGVKKHPKNQREQNLRRFKLKFSSNVSEYAAIYNIAFRPMQYFRYRLLRKVKRIISGTVLYD